MKRKILAGMLGGVVLGGALGAGVVLASARHMQDALNHLNNAKAALEQAQHDKGGYRQRALEHVTQAIGEVQKGMQYADEHK
jgi:hypothetical protein